MPLLLLFGQDLSILSKMSELRPTIDLGFSSVKLNIDLIKCATSPKAFALMVSDIRERRRETNFALQRTQEISHSIWPSLIQSSYQNLERSRILDHKIIVAVQTKVNILLLKFCFATCCDMRTV